MILGLRPRLTIVLLLAGAAVGCAEPVYREAVWSGFGGEARVGIWMTTEQDAEEALAQALAALRQAEETMAFGREGSELDVLNREARRGFYAVEDPDFYRCVLLALDYARTSRGAFDPTVGAITRLYGFDAKPDVPTPDQIASALTHVGWDRVVRAPEARALRFRDPEMALDLGRVVRGCALDNAARALARPGSRGALLQLGGARYAWNAPPGELAWPVALNDPRSADRALLQIVVANRGVAVVGNPEPRAGPQPDPRLSVIDPSTGRPVGSEILVAVAVAHSARDAEALATALAASSYSRATDLIERMRRIEAVLLVRGEDSPYVLASGSLRGRLELSEALERETGGDVRYLLPPQDLAGAS